MNNQDDKFKFTREMQKASLLNAIDTAIADCDEAKAMAQKAIADLEKAKEERRRRTQEILNKYPQL